MCCLSVFVLVDVCVWWNAVPGSGQVLLTRSHISPAQRTSDNGVRAEHLRRVEVYLQKHSFSLHTSVIVEVRGSEVAKPYQITHTV